VATKTGRIKKHQLKEDQFVTRTFQIAGFFQRHKNRATLIVAGVLFLVAVVALFTRFQAGSRREVSLQLSRGVGMFQAGNYSEAAFQLSAFVESHPRAKDAAYAALLAGDAHFYMSRWEEAGRHYRLALEKSKEKSEIWYAARAGLASVDEGLGRPLEAARGYEELAQIQESAAARAHMSFSAARAYRQGGEIEKAAEMLETLDPSLLDPIDQANLDVLKTAVDFARAELPAADQ
jgi:tetratricopeptide (TPR) repeat protein